MLPGGVVRWLPVVAVSLAVLPAAALVVPPRARALRGRGVPAQLARRHAIAEVGLVAGTLPWLWMILTPLPAAREVRALPLRDLADLLAGAPLTAFFQIGGNLLVFAALGFFAAARWGWGPLAATAAGALASLAVESSQYLLALGRVSSVDDVLLNAAGAGIAAALCHRWWPLPAPSVC